MHYRKPLNASSANRMIACGRVMPLGCKARHVSTLARKFAWHQRPTRVPIPVVGGRPGPRLFLLTLIAFFMNYCNQKRGARATHISQTIHDLPARIRYTRAARGFERAPEVTNHLAPAVLPSFAGAFFIVANASKSATNFRSHKAPNENRYTAAAPGSWPD